MKIVCGLLAALSLGACVPFYDGRPSSIERSARRTDELGRPCPSGAGVYVAKKQRYETPYDKVVRDSARQAGQSTLGCDRPPSNT